MKLALSALCCLLGLALGQPTFTGNARNDFSVNDYPDKVNTITFNDGIGDAGLPQGFPSQWFSGWDFDFIYMHYDFSEDRMYFGFNSPSPIIGDADGDGDPSFPSPQLAALGGDDLPSLGGEESIVINMIPPGATSTRLLLGVGNAFNITECGVYTPLSAPLADSFPTAAFLTKLRSCELYADPNSNEPSLEFSISQFSELPGMGFTPGQAFSFRFFAASGAGFQDSGIGEDRMPASGRATFTWPTVGTANVGGFVFHDVNINGEYEPLLGETPIADAFVELQNAALGFTLTSTSTGSDGNFLFQDVIEGGPYQIKINRPGQYVGYSPPGVTSIVDPDTGITPTFTVVAFVNQFGKDAGLFGAATIGDQVWRDTNDNNVYDDGVDAVVEGALVRLFNSTGDEIAQTQTDSNGNYLFDLLLPGTYSVGFNLLDSPPNRPTRFVSANVGADEAVDSDADPLTGQTTPITLGSLESNLNVDAGVVNLPLGSKGNFVFHDVNDNGLYEPIDGDSPLSGVVVNLIGLAGDGCFSYERQVGEVLNTTTTDASGSFSFEGLSDCDYYLEFELPAGYRKFSPIDPSAGDDDNRADENGIIGPVTVDGTSGSLVFNECDAGIVGDADIGDFVFEDLNENGVYDSATESPLEGIVVILTDADNGFAPLDQTTTDVNGNYLFQDLLPGNYRITFELPDTPPQRPYRFTSPGPDSVINPSTGNGPTFFLRSLEDNLAQDGGLARVPMSIGDLVFHDVNGNGVNDLEPGVPNIVVRLLGDEASGCRSFANAPLGNNVLAETTTDSNGRYLFTELVPCVYTIEFVLPGQFSQFSPIPTNAQDDDNAAGPSGRINSLALDIGDSISTADAGLVGTADVGDFVFVDANRDGVYNQVDGDEPLEGIVVELLDINDIPIATTTSASDGSYLFADNLPGFYRVRFRIPDSPPARPYDITVPGSDNAADPDGFTSQFELLSLQDNLDQDGGFVYVPIAIGDFVFHDVNADGLFVAGDGDVPLAGVTVNLVASLLDGCRSFEFDRKREEIRTFADVYEERMDNMPLTMQNKLHLLRKHKRMAIGDVVASTTTDANGFYQFQDLVPCDFFVEFELPAGFTSFSPTPLAGPSNNDNFADSDGVIGPISVDRNDVYETADAGMFGQADIGDFVFEDVNGDGAFDSQVDVGFGGLTVELLDENSNVLAATSTATDGSYLFANRNPGLYRVQFTLPPSPPSVPYQFITVGPDTVVNSAGLTPQFELISQVANLDQDAAIQQIPLASIETFVFHDLDNDGDYETPNGEAPVPGITVTLIPDAGCDVFGSLNGQSDANGQVIFTGLTPCTYQVCFTLEAPYDLFSPLGGDDSVVAQDGCIGGITPAFGEEITGVDAGLVGFASIGDFVWEDVNFSDAYEPSEDNAFDGVVVNLLDAGDLSVITSALTNSDGFYTFDSLLPGDYVVEFRPPVSNVPYEFVTPGPDSVAAELTGRSPVVTVVSNEDNLDQDAGLYDATPPTCCGNCRRGFRPGCSRADGNCECYCDNLCVALGDCCADFCDCCPRVDRVGCGTAVGDPHMVGFWGESYELAGKPGDVVNLISSEQTQVNVRMANACRGSKTVFGAVGFQFNGHRVEFSAPEAGSLNDKPVVLLDGHELPENELTVLASEEQERAAREARGLNPEDHHIAQNYVLRSFDDNRRYGGETLRFVTPDFSISAVYRRHTHCGQGRVDLSVQFRDPEETPEGLLGMSERRQEHVLRDHEVNKHGEIVQFIYDLYKVGDSDLFGDNFARNQFLRSEEPE